MRIRDNQKSRDVKKKDTRERAGVSIIGAAQVCNASVAERAYRCARTGDEGAGGGGGERGGTSGCKRARARAVAFCKLNFKY